MADEPTPGELERSLNRFRLDVRDDIASLRLDLRTGLASVETRVVHRDVYDADDRRRAEELQVMRNAIQRIDDDTAAERRAAQAWRDKRDANRKWLIAAVLLPIGGIITELIYAIRGIH